MRGHFEDHDARVLWMREKIERTFGQARVQFVEIGVWRAYFSERLLPLLPNVYWIGIDPYVVYDGKKIQFPYQHRWDKMEKNVHSKMRKYGSRFILFRETSEEAIKHFKDKTIDVLFIDGDHSYEAVLRDIELYEEKVRLGGIVAGHDYYAYPTVKEAVDCYAQAKGKNLQVEQSENVGIWWWIKSLP